MSVRYPKVAITGDSGPERLLKFGQAINGLLEGNSNNAIAVTLDINATETVVANDLVHPDTVALFSPQTANAAAVAAGVYFTAGNRSLTIHHGSYSHTDMRFGVILCG